jgi:hypothetical protein
MSKTVEETVLDVVCLVGVLLVAAGGLVGLFGGQPIATVAAGGVFVWLAVK